MANLTYKYVACTLADVAEGITFDVPRQNQGQIVEVAYGDFGRSGGWPGDPYKRVTDQSDGKVTYYRRVEVQS